MTRDTLRHRFRVLAPLVAVVAVIALTAWLGVKFRSTPVGQPDGDTSLLVLVHMKESDKTADRHQLFRVPFKGSEPQPPESVWEGENRPFYSLGTHRIIDDRFVVAGDGTVIDVWERCELHRANPVGACIESNSDRVISGVHTEHTRERIISFDLKTRRARKLSGPEAEPFSLPGRRSPDGTASVSWPALDGNLTLHRVGHAPLPLGRFQTTAGLASDYPPPALWIDNTRFLTQAGNGNLITVALDGTRTLVANVPVKPELVIPPRLTRDANDRIIYTCGGEGFVIDVEAKTWARCPWASLGHGFDATWEPAWPGRSIIRYQGKEIGEFCSWPHRPGRSACADARLAVIDEKCRVRVWFAGSGTWTVLDTPADGLIGWLK